MAVGIPVIASPIPSYRGSPAILLPNFKEDWVTVTKSLLTDQSKYQALSEKGIAYVKSRYHTNVVMTKYKRLFDQVLSQ
jgi:hypothetical protein